VQHEPPARALRIYGAAKRTEMDAAFAKIRDCLNEMRERTAQPVELPYQQSVARFKRYQRGVEAGTPGNNAANALVRENPTASGRFQRVPLKGEVLVCRRDSGLADKHRVFLNGLSKLARP
jgi:hypothetical protein